MQQGNGDPVEGARPPRRSPESRGEDAAPRNREGSAARIQGGAKHLSGDALRNTAVPFFVLSVVFLTFFGSFLGDTTTEGRNIFSSAKARKLLLVKQENPSST